MTRRRLAGVLRPDADTGRLRLSAASSGAVPATARRPRTNAGYACRASGGPFSGRGVRFSPVSTRITALFRYEIGLERAFQFLFDSNRDSNPLADLAEKAIHSFSGLLLHSRQDMGVGT